MQVHEIKREHALKKKKLVARGGKRGKTAGRGGKGQTARAGNKRRPAMRDIIKKIPKLRGHGKNRSKSVYDRGPHQVVNVSLLNTIAKGTVVTPKLLAEMNLISVKFAKMPTVKILATGDITAALTIEGCDVSATAKAKIEKAGGTVVEIPKKEKVVKVVKKESKKEKAPAKKKAKK